MTMTEDLAARGIEPWVMDTEDARWLAGELLAGRTERFAVDHFGVDVPQWGYLITVPGTTRLVDDDAHIDSHVAAIMDLARTVANGAKDNIVPRRVYGFTFRSLAAYRIVEQWHDRSLAEHVADAREFNMWDVVNGASIMPNL